MIFFVLGSFKFLKRLYSLFFHYNLHLVASKGLFGKAPHEGLLYFLLKNGFSRKILGRAPLEELEPELKRSLAKQAQKLE